MAPDHLVLRFNAARLALVKENGIRGAFAKGSIREEAP
jgi:hypothetical protein